MQIDLTPRFFKGVVSAYLAIFLLCIPLAIYEITTPRWATFDAAFDELLRTHFEWEDWWPDWLYVIFGALSLLHMTATIGLIYLKRWARMLFWVSMLCLLILSAINPEPAYYYSQATSWLSLIWDGLLVIILLLAYSREHGSQWFAISDER